MKKYDLFAAPVELPDLAVEMYGDDGPIKVGKWLITDGDTVVDTDTGQAIRLRGIDTRETAKPEHGVAGERGGAEHRKALAELIRRSGGQLSVKSAGTDKYGRVVGTLYDAEGNDLNREMLQKGAAFEVFDGDDPYREDRIARLRDQDLRRQLGEEVRSEYNTQAYRDYANSRSVWQRDPDTGDVFKASVARGTDELQASLYKAAEWLGDATGVDSLSKWGESGFLRNVEEAAANPAQISRFDDIDSLSDGWTYFVETLGSQVPQLLVDAGLAATGAGVGAVAGRRAALAGANKALQAGAMKKVLQKMGPEAAERFERRVKSMTLKRGVAEGAKKGGWAAFAASTFPQHLGENYQAQQEAGIETPWGSFVPAVANTALDVYGTERLLSLILNDKKAAVDGIGGILAEGARRGGIGLTTEGITELAQSVVTEAAIKAQKDGHDIDWYDVFDAGIRGALVGGALGGAGGVIHGATAPTEFTPEPEQDVRAHARDLADPDSSRDTVIAHPENADAVADELAKSGVGTSRRTTEDGNVVFTTRDDVPAGTDAGNAEALGYTEPLGDVAADPDAVVVQARDATGAVVKEQGATAAGAQAARESLAKEYPDATIVEITPSDAQARRALLREREAQAFAEAPVAERPAPPAYAIEPEYPDEKPVVRNGIAPPELQGTKSVFADDGRTLRPAKEVLPELARGEIDIRTLAEAMDNAGIARTGTAITEQVKIDRYQLAKDLRTAGVYALGGDNNRALDVALSDVSDAELFELARKHKVPVFPERKIRTGEAARLVVQRARENDWARRNLEKVGLLIDGQLPTPSVLTRMGEDTVRRALWAVSDPKEARLEELETEVTESNRARLRSLYNRLRTEQQSYGPSDAAVASNLERFEKQQRQDKAARERVKREYTENDETADVDGLIPVLFSVDPDDVVSGDYIDGLAFPIAPSDITETQLTDAALSKLARQLGIKFSNRDFDRNALIRSVQEHVADRARADSSEGPSAESLYSEAEPFVRRAAYDAAVLEALGREVNVDTAPLRSRVANNVYVRYSAAIQAEKRFSLGDFARAVEALVNDSDMAGAGVRSHVSATLTGPVVEGARAAGIKDADALYRYAVKNALVEQGDPAYEPQYRSAERAPTDPAHPNYRPRARAKGESDTPPATQSDEEVHADRQKAALRGAVAFLIDGRVSHVGAGRNSSVWSADVMERSQRLNGESLIYGLVSEGHAAMFGKNGAKPATLMGAVDAVRLTNLGREYASSNFGGLYGELYNSFLNGLELAMEAGRNNDMPVAIDEAFVTDELIIAEHPDTGEAIRLGDARERMQRESNFSSPLNQLDPFELRVKIESLEKELLANWEAIDFDSLGEREGQLLDDWFYQALNYGEPHGELAPDGTPQGVDARWERISNTDYANDMRRLASRLAPQSVDLQGQLILARRARNDHGGAWQEDSVLGKDDFGFDDRSEMDRIRDAGERQFARNSADVPVATVGVDTLRRNGGGAETLDFSQLDYDRDGNPITEDGTFDYDAALEHMAAHPEFAAVYDEVAALYGEDVAYDYLRAMDTADNPEAASRALTRARLSQPVLPLVDALQAAIASAPNETARQKLQKTLDEVQRSEALRRQQELQDLALKEAKAEAVRAQADAAREQAAALRAEIDLKAALNEQGVVAHTGRKFIDRAAYYLVRAARQVSGLRMPLLIVSRSKLSSLKGIRPEARAALARNLAKGDKGDAAFMAAGDYGVIVLPDAGRTFEVITKLAHEVGHAFMETHFQVAADKDVKYLRRLHKQQTGSTDDAAFREWAADQWAHWAVGQGNLLTRYAAKGVDSLFARILKMMYRVWDTARALLDNPQASFEFSAYLRRVAEKATRGTTAVRSLQTGEVLNYRVKSARMARAIKAKAVAAWRNPFQGVYRMVYTRLRDISPRLQELLYQQSVTRNSTGRQSWQTLTNHLSDRWQGRINAALKGFSDAQIMRGWQALRDGRDTPIARKLRRLIDSLNRDIAARTVYHPRPDFIPEAFSHEQLASRRDEFDAMLAEHFADMSVDGRRVLIDSILYSDGITDLTAAPGKPVSQHANVDRLLSNLAFARAAAKNGFLLDNPVAILHHFAQSAAKRTAWEEIFGGYVELKRGTRAEYVRNRMLADAHVDLDRLKTDEARRKAAERLGLERDGRFFSPNARFVEELERIRVEKGVDAMRQARALVRNAMGLDGHNIPDGIRNAQNWLLTYLNYTMLAFSGLVSIPEIAGGNIRGAGRVGLRDTLEVLREFRAEKSRAEDLGVVMSDMTEKAVLESMGPEYQSPAQHKLNYWLFKLNGQQAVMRTARVMALGLGRRYILRTTQATQRGDKRALDELAKLNLTLDQASQWLLNGQKDVPAVDEALTQFVYESVVQPSRFEATTWGNNPWFKLAWHLKQFFYSYFNRILGGIWRAMGGRYSAARDEGYGVITARAYSLLPGIVAAGLLVPMAMGAQELREWIQQIDRTDNMDGVTYATLVYDKIGGLGPFSILANMKQASDWGRSPLMALTTTTSRLEQLMSLGSDGELSEQELENKIRILIPFFSQNKAAWDAVTDW